MRSSIVPLLTNRVTVTGPAAPIRWARLIETIFNGRIPPAIEQKDVLAELQIQSDASRAVAHQNHMRLWIGS